MAVDNATILDKVWLAGNNDYQRNVPRPTQTNISQQIEAIFDPMNRQYYNYFVDALITRIGATYVHQQSWKNPLSFLKKGKLEYGATEQEIAVKWIKAHSYKDDAEDLFKMYRPDAGVWYHSQNRQDKYPITIVEDELRLSFTGADDGLNQFVAAVLESPINKDEYDEYLIMKQLIAFYEHNYGFFKENLSAVPSDDATGKEFLRKARMYAEKLAYPSALYNSGLIPDIPVFAKKDELILFTTPELNATLDVDTLSSVFQLDKAELKYRTITLDEFPIPNAVALLTTKDFFRCRDTMYGTFAAPFNASTLATNYFLHHWGIYSVSPFAPAILFTTDAATSVTTITQTVTTATLTVPDATQNKVTIGENYQTEFTLNGTLSSTTENIKTVEPQSATYDVTVTRAGDDDSVEVVKSPRTRVDKYGILHVAKNLEAGDTINIVAKSTYVNPSGATTDITATLATALTVQLPA